MESWIWDLDLQGMVGRFISVELADTGIIREGKVTSVKVQQLEINGEHYPLPVGIEINGDPLDVVNFSQLKKIRLD